MVINLQEVSLRDILANKQSNWYYSSVNWVIKYEHMWKKYYNAKKIMKKSWMRFKTGKLERKKLLKAIVLIVNFLGWETRIEWHKILRHRIRLH